MAERSRTIVEYFAEHERYKCGYCGKSDTNYSHGMWAHSMNVQDYQDLLDRGWRRSGKYTYKPTMNMTCCPQCTIRCEVLDFKLRKSHKKALKKVNKYLIHGIKPSKDEEDLDDEEPKSKKKPIDPEKPTTSQEQTETITAEGNTEMEPSTSGNQPEENLGTSKEKSVPGENKNEPHGKQSGKTLPRPGSGHDPSKPPCKKAKELRREKKLAKLAAQGVTAGKSVKNPSQGNKQEPKTLEDFLNEPSKAENCAHKLEIRLVRSYPESPEFSDSLTESHAIYHRYQMSIHGDPPDKPALKQYKRFLVDSPLEEEKEEGGIPDGYGSFHQQYILDGKIICVGVIDILPSLVSSKYLYYDPDYSFLSLGVYSALQEIAFVRSLHQYSKKMLYYYMGFYIHSCPKMRYKGQYFPSYLLCPETYTWHPVEKCAPKLDLNRYSRFADEDQVDENGAIDMSAILILFCRKLMTYDIYKKLSRGKNDDEEEVKEYASFVGKKCASSLCLFRK